MTYTQEETEFGEANNSLGAEYIVTAKIAERFLSKWKEEHTEKIAEEIVKPIVDQITEKAWIAFTDHLLTDTEYNLAQEMRYTVEKSVKALIGGEKWAYVKYISPEGYNTEAVRETLAKMYSDEIKDARISDLEKEIKALQDRINNRYF